MKSVCLRDADISRIKNIFKRFDSVLIEIKGATTKDIENDTILGKAIKLDLAQIGEHVKHLPTPIKKYFTSDEYTSLMNMRNLISHEYETVNFSTIYNTIRDIIIPAIKRLRESEVPKEYIPN